MFEQAKSNKKNSESLQRKRFPREFPEKLRESKREREGEDDT